ncbi:MAG: hypothetical protein ACJAVM_002868 [Sulfitobacter sp.]|jgi:hypothetical protein
MENPAHFRVEIYSYAKLYLPEAGGVSRLREAACWAHLRRDFHDFWTSTKSKIACEALDRIGKLQPTTTRSAPIRRTGY